MDLSKVLRDAPATGNCHSQCRFMVDILGDAAIRKAYNKKNPWGDNPSFTVEHLTGNYVFHFVVQAGDFILDPFLRAAGPISVRDYLNKAFKNPEEIELV